jgi:K+-transporting ATPase ATPase A chain
MTTNGLIQIGLYLVILVAAVRPLGLYMARVYEGKPVFLDRVLGPVERIFYRVSGVCPETEMNWKVYALAVLLFNAVGLVVVYILQRLQGALPLNPRGFTTAGRRP